MLVRGGSLPVSIFADLDDQSRALLRRLQTAGGALLLVALGGALGFHVIGEGKWSFADCLYMSIITLSTVGFGELPGLAETPWARAWTGLLIVLGSGTMVYFASTFTAMLVEGDLRGAIRRRQVKRMLDNLQNHVIVCGVGSTGIHVVEELAAAKTAFVVIERSEERIEKAAEVIRERFGTELVYVVGDATDDHVLHLAGIERAKGLISALTDDRDNLFVVVTARALSERLRIVAKAVEQESVVKLERAGADSVVAPAYIGALRLAAEMVQPNVMQFLDGMLRQRDASRRIEEILVTADSPLSGKTLAEARLRDDFGTLIIAIRYLDGSHAYNPSPQTVLKPGMVLVAIVSPEDAAALRAHVARP